MEDVKVSICIPTYNGAQFITEALESVAFQSYTNIEIVVSDDNSEDNTIDLIKSFKGKTKIPIHLHKHKPKGIGANWNNCINKAKGEYIKFLFQDDILEPDCIKKMVNILDNESSVNLVACQRLFLVESNYDKTKAENWINKFGNLQSDLQLEQTQYGLKFISQDLFKSKFFLKSPLNKVGEPTAVMFRKKIIDSIGYFREDLKQILDYEFYYRLLKTSKIGIMDEPLVKFRLHPKQTTMINERSSIKYDDNYSKILYDDFLPYLDDYTQLHLKKKFNIWYKAYYKLKSKINLLLGQ